MRFCLLNAVGASDGVEGHASRTVKRRERNNPRANKCLNNLE